MQAILVPNTEPKLIDKIASCIDPDKRSLLQVYNVCAGLSIPIIMNCRQYDLMYAITLIISM